MELHEIPEAFQTKLRIAVLSALISGKKDFNTLKEVIKATDGNLSVQLSKLEDMGYLTSSKKIVAKKTKTTYCISENGRKEFEDYVMMLEEIVKSSMGLSPDQTADKE